MLSVARLCHTIRLTGGGTLIDLGMLALLWQSLFVVCRGKPPKMPKLTMPRHQQMLD